jgi:transcriptional regulator with XRE-family HTH domain
LSRLLKSSIKYEDTTQRGTRTKGLKREVAQLVGIDQALISKFESGNRRPTKEQVVKLAILLEIDFESIMVSG